MIVYYIADDEHPETHEGVKFYLDHASAQDAALMERKMVFSFEVNDKCDTNSFGMDTIMVFRKDHDSNELKFLASGKWLEIHDILNIPFYYDFEKRSNVYVSMSLKYFNAHYFIEERTGSKDNVYLVQDASKMAPEKLKKPKQEKSVPEKQEQHTEQSDANLGTSMDIDEDVLGELFGVPEQPKNDLTNMLFSEG